MDVKHYLPEQQFLGRLLISEVHEETGVAYLEIVEEFDLTSGLYTASYYEVPPDGEPEAIVGNWYTAAQLTEILGDNETS